MAKLFYDHLIVIEEIEILLDGQGLSGAEKKELLATIDEIFHHEILDTILTQLPKQHHEEFLQKLVTHPYDPGILPYLSEKAEKNMEREILQTIAQVKTKIHKEVKKKRHTQ